MLGRLEMDVEKCISTYIDLMKSVLEKKLRRKSISLRGKIKPQFDSKKLRSAVERVISDNGASPEDRFNNEHSRGCKVYVPYVTTGILTY